MYFYGLRDFCVLFLIVRVRIMNKLVKLHRLTCEIRPRQ
jgi:hypothetical protein